MQDAIERAVSTMWQRYDEPLSLDAMAHSAFLSRFYFSRSFRSVTGTSPGRFLSAIRLYQAKKLLLETELSVTDIAYGVGYNSPGTFISRFSRSVGLPPARYRCLVRRGLPQLGPAGPAVPPRPAVIRGRLTVPSADTPVKVYVGVFDSPIVQGRPPSCDVLGGSGEYRLSEVPPGTWHLRAAAIRAAADGPQPPGRRLLAVAASGPVTVTSGVCLTVDLTLHETGALDLPILVALPGLDGCGGPGRRLAAAEGQRRSG